MLGYLIARRGLKPLADMGGTVSGIKASTLDVRLDPAGMPSELNTLALSFNDTLSRLEDAFSRISRYSADIAHELRTPVNNLRGEAEVALGQSRSPEEYRDKWSLPPDYPMVAPNYAAARSALAKKMGLGQQRRRKG